MFANRCSSEFFYFPGRIIQTRHNHIMAFAPARQFDLDSRQWIEESEFSKLGDVTQELFFSRDASIYYGGTFKCHRLQLQLKKYALPWRIVNGDTTAIPDVSDGSTSQSRRVAAPILKNTGTKKSRAKFTKTKEAAKVNIECIVLQCVGFNDELYQILSQSQAAIAAMAKRKPSITDSDQRPAKKRKVAAK